MGVPALLPHILSDGLQGIITLAADSGKPFLWTEKRVPIIPGVIRRIHVPVLWVGVVELAPAQAHHLRDVLRLQAGDEVTAFDDAGATGQAKVREVNSKTVHIEIEQIEPAPDSGFSWSIATAIPKGQRADWMVEKLAELGTDAMIPLATERSVSLPSGKEKLARWRRLAEEASRQSGRSGVMRIESIRTPNEMLAVPRDGTVWYLSTAASAAPALKTLSQPRPNSLGMLVGPEGGWTESEMKQFDSAGIVAVKLAPTILRVETAAVAAAAMAAAWKSLDAVESCMDDLGQP